MKERVLKQALEVLEIEAEAILALRSRIQDHFFQAVQLISKCPGKLVVTGIGKSGHVARKLASTFSSTGTPAVFLHPAESAHGDLGLITSQDVVLALSYGGESRELLTVLEYVARKNIALIAMTGKVESTLAKASQVVLDVSVAKEACPHNLAPTASSTATLALGDALAMSVLVEKGFRPEDFADVHPGGSLGAKLVRVADIMHSGEALPLVQESTSIKDIVGIMTHRDVRGTAGVLNPKGDLIGVITDGDIRRRMEKFSDPLNGTALDLMNRSPKTIDQNELAEKALFLMEQMRIQTLFVLDAKSSNPLKPVGMINFHDLFKAKVR
ncbi:MAG: SIS domain-containing protein [Bdellovibrionales bacterium]